MAFRGIIHTLYKNEADCARELGWDRRKLNKITTGRKVPTIDELDELARVLNSSIGELAPYFLTNKSPNEQQ